MAERRDPADREARGAPYEVRVGSPDRLAGLACQERLVRAVGAADEHQQRPPGVRPREDQRLDDLADLDAHRGRRVLRRARPCGERTHLRLDAGGGQRLHDALHGSAHRRTSGARGLGCRPGRSLGKGGGMKKVCLVALCAAAVAAAGCGGGSSNKSSTSGAPTGKAKQGGHLTVLYNGDVDFIDPGITYYQYGFNVAYMTQRPLFSYKPDDATNAVPDLADGNAQISNGGKTVTIKIKKGIKFSPPVSREVTSADVKYALERGYNPNVAGEYLAYFADVKGAAEATKNAKAGATPDI